MIVTVASHKGGVGKTTTAVHLAAYLQTLAPTLLLDGDDTRNATAWSQRGKGFAFKVADKVQAARLARNFTHTVIDTGQRPKQVDLRALAEGCDLLVIPAVPASLDTDGLVLTLQALRQIGRVELPSPTHKSAAIPGTGRPAAPGGADRPGHSAICGRHSSAESVRESFCHRRGGKRRRRPSCQACVGSLCRHWKRDDLRPWQSRVSSLAPWRVLKTRRPNRCQMGLRSRSLQCC